MTDAFGWREAQRWLFHAVTQGQTEPSEHLIGTEVFPAERGLAVYANAYFVRLVGCLSESFPAVSRTLGEDAFSDLAVDYLRALPPAGPNLGTLGRGFADHLDATRPESTGMDGRSLVALARYEWALDQVFDGPGSEGTPGLTSDALSSLSPETWLETSLVANPALCLLRLETAVDGYCHTVRGLSPEDAVPPLPTEGPRWLALSRRAYVVRRLVCERSEFALLGHLAQGASIGQALLGVDVEITPEQMHRWFARWMTEGLFVALDGC